MYPNLVLSADMQSMLNKKVHLYVYPAVHSPEYLYLHPYSPKYGVIVGNEGANYQFFVISNR
jgi:hypothetical protein